MYRKRGGGSQMRIGGGEWEETEDRVELEFKIRRLNIHLDDVQRAAQRADLLRCLAHEGDREPDRGRYHVPVVPRGQGQWK